MPSANFIDVDVTKVSLFFSLVDPAGGGIASRKFSTFASRQKHPPRKITRKLSETLRKHENMKTINTKCFTCVT